MQSALAAFPPMHQLHDTIILKELHMLMNKKAGEKRDTLIARKAEHDVILFTYEILLLNLMLSASDPVFYLANS